MQNFVNAGSLLRRVHETLDGYLALGNERIEVDDARFVRCRETPSIYDANFACRVRAAAPEAIDAVLERVAACFEGQRHRHFRIDPDTPYALLAFHPDFIMGDLPPTSREHAERCLAAAEAAGLTRVRLANEHLLD